jgi:alpha-beta hydrolase superfamily lysophospholipase
VLGVAAFAVAGTVAISISLDQAPSTPGRPTAKTTTTSTVPKGPPYAVGIISLEITESATTGGSVRSLPTEVRYPTTGPAGAPEQPGARSDRASGPYPLVVFSEGYDISPEAYAQLLDAWSAAGYVVADPTYPFTSPSSPGGLDENDIVNHPADLSFVITSLLEDGATTGGPLSGLINPSEVAVIGHSDGGDVALAAASNSCCRDSHIKAAVILSGAELASFGGTYYATPPIPMLVVQGTDDDINPLNCSVQIYDAAPQPKYYLSLAGQTHESPYLQAGQPLGIVEKVTIDFLDGYLRHSTAQLDAMTGDGSVTGLATLTSLPSVGSAVGSCPGAPQG